MPGRVLSATLPVVITVAFLCLAAAPPTLADAADDAAAWLNKLGLKYRNKPWDRNAVLSTRRVNLARARGIIKAADMRHLAALPRLTRLNLGQFEAGRRASRHGGPIATAGIAWSWANKADQRRVRRHQKNDEPAQRGPSRDTPGRRGNGCI